MTFVGNRCGGCPLITFYRDFIQSEALVDVLFVQQEGLWMSDHCGSLMAGRTCLRLTGGRNVGCQAFRKEFLQNRSTSFSDRKSVV